MIKVKVKDLNNNRTKLKVQFELLHILLVYQYSMCDIMSIVLILVLKKAQQQEEVQQYGQKRVSKLREKPLSPNDRNNESQAHKMINGSRMKQRSPKKSREGSSKPKGCRKVKMGQNRPEVMK